ncbi:SRPBCC family protein [Rhodohalobacter sulfatireducens]|uniref:SRPBCC family protein n=1 Tax=Rhodohalobacter sulfatireducens TaxID=2911366 RepID=A0ABS9KF55_9BACT|nr:SRPBCC family protein [Rhodohalobacter sulfatireducens]MCG2589471.1 SRPBCC family protein [Rhodohalobacter sulfatireducens]
MPKVEITKRINAPQKQVWEFISDIEKAPEWVVVMKSLIHTTENPVKLGTVYHESSKIGLKKSKTEWEITYFDAPHMQAHECNESDFKATLKMRVEDNGDGTSILFHSTDYQLMPNFKLLGRLLETIFINRLMSKNLNQSVINCKQMIENKY